MSVSAIEFQNNESNEFCGSSEDYSIVGLISFADSDKKVYSNLFCATTNDGTIYTQTLNWPYTNLDVGKNSRVSLAYQNSKLCVLEVHDHGYCWNNERDNKRADVG